MKKFGKILKWVLVVIILLAGAMFFLSRPLSYEHVGDQAVVIHPGLNQTDGVQIENYKAVYQTKTYVLGIPIEQGEVAVSANNTGDSVHVSFDFKGRFVDKLVLIDSTLAPVSRSFPGQRFTFNEHDVLAVVDRTDGSTDSLTFTFEQPVFEVSLLEWVIATSNQITEEGAFLSWDNFADPSQSLAEVRITNIDIQISDYQINKIADVRFADGKIRRFYLSDQPPYKIRQEYFEMGKLVKSTWDLVSYQ